MKKKSIKKILSFFFAFIICFQFVFKYSYADDVLSVNIQKNEYDEYIKSRRIKGTDLISIPSHDSRVVAVSVAGSVASTLLALAVKAGFDFVDAGGMDNFLARFLALDSAKALVDSLSKDIKNAINGIITISRTTINSIAQEFNRIRYAKDFGYMSTGYTDNLGNSDKSLLTVSRYKGDISTYSDKNYNSYILNNSTFAYTFTKDDILNNVDDSNVYNFEFIQSGTNKNIYNTEANFYFTIKSNGDLSLKIGHKVGFSGDYYYLHKQTLSSMSKLSKVVIVPYYSKSSSDTELFFSIGIFDSYGKMLVYDYSYYNCSSSCSIYVSERCSYVSDSVVINDSAIGVIGDAWKDGNVTDDGSNADDISISIPKDTNSLVGVPPSSITVNPPYDIWKPGDSISPPAVDTPSVGFTPDIESPPDVENPPIDIPDTSKPLPDWIFPTLPDVDFDWEFGEINFEPLKKNFHSFKNRFPFSLPFDFYNILDSFISKSKALAYSKNDMPGLSRSSDSLAPIFTVPMPYNNEIILDMSIFDKLAGLGRFFVGVGFSIILIMITRKVVPR